MNAADKNAISHRGRAVCGPWSRNSRPKVANPQGMAAEFLAVPP